MCTCEGSLEFVNLKLDRVWCIRKYKITLCSKTPADVGCVYKNKTTEYAERIVPMREH